MIYILCFSVAYLVAFNLVSTMFTRLTHASHFLYFKISILFRFCTFEFHVSPTLLFQMILFL